MGGFDWVILAILLVSVVVGIMRGFIKEALSLTSWIVALWLAITFSHQIGDFVSQNIVEIPADVFRVSAGFTLIFVVTLFLFAVISFLVTKLVLHGPVKEVDRALGIIFGALRASAIVVAIMLVARGMGFDSSQWWSNSRYLPYFLPTADFIEPLLPTQLQSPETDNNSLEKEVIKQALENIQVTPSGKNSVTKSSQP